MDEHDDTLTALVTEFRETAEAAHRKARFRIGLTMAMIAFVGAYMAWIHNGLSQLDAPAVTAIARIEVESRLPEMGAQLTQAAKDAAPGLLDRGEGALMSAPSMLRDHLEGRLLDSSDDMVARATEHLNEQLTLAFEVKLEGLQEQTGGQRITMDEMIQQLRGDYRASVTGMSDQLYVEYAEEIHQLDEFLVRLRTDEHLSPRERTQKEIIEASVALRSHFITPIQPITLNDEQSD
jgi:hypothetical protein